MNDARENFFAQLKFPGRIPKFNLMRRKPIHPKMMLQRTKQKLLCPRFWSAWGAFTVLYLMVIRMSKQSDNEYLRLGAAGALTFLICEFLCYPFDIINF